MQLHDACAVMQSCHALHDGKKRLHDGKNGLHDGKKRSSCICIIRRSEYKGAVSSEYSSEYRYDTLIATPQDNLSSPVAVSTRRLGKHIACLPTRAVESSSAPNISSTVYRPLTAVPITTVKRRFAVHTSHQPAALHSCDSSAGARHTLTS